MQCDQYSQYRRKSTMISDIVFNGAQLKLRTGRWSKANASDLLSANTLNDGLYTLDLKAARQRGAAGSSGTPLLYDTRQSILANHLIPITPNLVVNGTRTRPAYLHDYRYKGRTSGIKIKPAFFKFINTYALNTGKDQLRLKIAYGNQVPWMVTAQQELGEHEVAGSKANPKILQYFKSSKFWGTDDSGGENAWCASFTAWVMEQHGYTPPKNAFRAKSWANFGEKVSDPTYGAIGVKSRAGGGHVAFVVGKSQDGKHLYMLGGNQSDEVNIRKYDRSVWETFVIPKDYDNSNDWLPVYNQKAASSGRES